MHKIVEGSIVAYIDHYGFKVKGKVVSCYTSVTGHQCVNINNFIIARKVIEVDLIK